jgi:hypothetical protein
MGNNDLMIFRDNKIKLQNPDAKIGSMTEGLQGIFREVRSSPTVSLYFKSHTDHGFTGMRQQE